MITRLCGIWPWTVLRSARLFCLGYDEGKLSRLVCVEVLFLALLSSHLLVDVLSHRLPGMIDVGGRTEDVYSFETTFADIQYPVWD